jgi:hypothetical protein
MPIVAARPARRGGPPSAPPLETPTARLNPLVEWRARRIQDPIARLRYLQALAAGRPARRHWEWRAAAMLAAFLAFPLHPASEATADLRSAALHRREAAPGSIPDVWLVDKTRDHELYSNGLRVEARYGVPHRPRRFLVFDRSRPQSSQGEWRYQPAGIVFHSTESNDVPFEADRARELTRIGADLLRFVQEKRAYHFVIDRFGRVHRVVAESDAADHAGHSVWGDERWLYLNLNASFLGVAFEARTEREEDALTQAQMHAGRILTDMLRSKYKLRAENCVTHAQVSVNPDNMRVGYHTDWAAGFPFQSMGLTDNYAQPLPGPALFGFRADAAFLELAGDPLRQGAARGEEQMRAGAALAGATATQFRRTLQKRYREKLSALRIASAPEEKKHESE